MSPEFWQQLVEIHLLLRKIPVIDELMAHVPTPETASGMTVDDYDRLVTRAVEGYVALLRTHYNKVLEQANPQVTDRPCSKCKPEEK